MLPRRWTSLQKASSTSEALVKMLKRQSLCFSARRRTSFLRTRGSPPVSMKRWVPRALAWLTRESHSSKVRLRALP